MAQVQEASHRAQAHEYGTASEHSRIQSRAIGDAEVTANPALNAAPSGRWTLRDKAAQRPLAPR